MKLTEKVKGFLKMTGHYADSAMYLAEHGYNDEYMRQLGEELSTAKNPRDKAEGQALTAQAYLFKGQLRKALEEFEKTDIGKLPSHLNSVFVNNYILCLFLLDKPSRVKAVYEEYNPIALAESTNVMRRTVGIKEYVDKRYENAVTVFIKLLSEPDPRVTLMADICLVRAMLALDMNERAREIAEMGFGRYIGMGDITAEVNRLKLRMNGKNTVHTKKKRKK